MPQLTESDIETLALNLLNNQGFKLYPYPRQSPEEVILPISLKSTLTRLNPNLQPQVLNDAFRKIQSIPSPSIMSSNEAFHRMLTDGINVIYFQNTEERGDNVKLIDFKNPENNEFYVINQLTIKENNNTKRPDVILFINGLPLIVIELKNAVDENATLNSAFRQIQTYKNTISSLFCYNVFTVISDGLQARAGTISSEFSRFLAWKSVDGVLEASKLVSQLEVLIDGMLNKKTLLDLIENFIVFEKRSQEDLKTKIITIETDKKIASYHQYYAVNKAISSVIKASSADGNKKGGVIWHTQGSGKSLTMVFSASKLIKLLDNPTILVITDRNDLDDQLFDTFASSKQLLRQEPVQAVNQNHLKELLKVVSGGVVFTTIQKFQPETGNVYTELSDRRNIIVIADEAHRTQYGFKAKTIDEFDDDENLTGQRIVYGFAKYLRDALPNATYLGFTGTPIEGTDVNTAAVFGSYVDIYDIAKAVDDGATVRIFYESRLVKVNLAEEGKDLIKNLDLELEQDNLSDIQKSKAKATKLEAIIGSENRIKSIAKDIINHFKERQLVFEGKAMIVTMSRRIAVALYSEIKTLCPEWHNEDLDKGLIKVVMTANSSDGPALEKHHTTKEERRSLGMRMKDPYDPLKIVIVRDMWLTGFDAPCLHTMYIDKPMRGHNLMQAIARVNRVYKDKPGGLIVDYLGIASDLKKALSFYSDNGGKGEPAEVQEKAVSLMLEKLEVVAQMFSGFNYHEYFTADTKGKLRILLEAEDFILGIEDGKSRFTKEVTALSLSFAIAIPHEKAMSIKDEVAFFQGIKSLLSKFNTTNNKTDEEVATTIRQVIDKALVSGKVLDVFDAAGIKKPDISILSDEFLSEIQGMKYKNIGLEVLKKLLNDEILTRSRTNLVQSKSLMEMLNKTLKLYQNKVITAAVVIEELIDLAREVKSKDQEAKNLGLTDYEYAFYTAVADNESARELMTKEKLRELAVVLAEKVKQNTTIDWSVKESVRSQLKVIVKRTLRFFGYPPDMEILATETVLKQAELISRDLSEEF